MKHGSPRLFRLNTHTVTLNWTPAPKVSLVCYISNSYTLLTTTSSKTKGKGFAGKADKIENNCDLCLLRGKCVESRPLLFGAPAYRPVSSGVWRKATGVSDACLTGELQCVSTPPVWAGPLLSTPRLGRVRVSCWWMYAPCQSIGGGEWVESKG